MVYSSLSYKPERYRVWHMWTCFGNLSFPKIRGCSGAEVCLWATAGAAWCRLCFHWNIFSVKLTAVCCFCFYNLEIIRLCECCNFPLKKTSYLGGQPRHGAPVLTHTPRCVGLTEGTDGPEQRRDLLRHHCRETPVTGCTREQRELSWGSSRWQVRLCTWQGWQVRWVKSAAFRSYEEHCNYTFSAWKQTK